MKHDINKYQHYALNPANEIVHINNAHRNIKFTCPHCGGEMILKQGKIRQWHFAHKTLTDNCCYETYLHALAKIKIRNYFYCVEKFEIELKTKEICTRKDSCIWFDCKTAEYCESSRFQKFDLKRYYNTCDMEIVYRNFRADLFLHDDADISRSPIFVEICVKHPCTEDKIKSGIRIIELVIKTEDDIESVMNSPLRESDTVRFYNFHRKPVGADSMKKWLNKFILYDSLKCFSKATDCKSYTKRAPKAIFEMTMSFVDNYIESDSLMGYPVYQIGLMTAYSYGYNIRNCYLCKYHHESYDDLSFNLDEENAKPIVCGLYKKLGTPKYCEYTQAAVCSAFRVDREFSDIVDEFMDKCDIWRKNDAE